MDIVILGLSITSSWGNGHATTYRGLVRELARRGHTVTFLERDVPWYASNPDLPHPFFGETFLYRSLEELHDCFADKVRQADLVVVGSYVPEGIAVGEWAGGLARGVLAFYDIDTPVTLARLKNGACDYLSLEQISRYDLYLSFSGGPILTQLEKIYRSPMARPFYCSADPEFYFPEESKRHCDLGYMGTYSPDRQPPLEILLIEPARQWAEGRFEVAGPQYPNTIRWPSNVTRVEHLPPSRRRDFYNRQRLTLNITRADMIRIGYSPSVRLFEAAACGTPVISDWWMGLESLFEPGKEILIARSPSDTLHYLRALSPETTRRIGEQARKKVLLTHTAAHRAQELEDYTLEAWKGRRRPKSVRWMAASPRDERNQDGRNAANSPQPSQDRSGARNHATWAMVSQPPPSRWRQNRSRPPSGRFPFL